MNQLPLKAYVKPPQLDKPCFVTPIFGDAQGTSYVQVTYDRLAVKDFEAFALGIEGLQPADADILATIGEEPVFAFFFSENDILFGKRSSLSKVLSKRLSELEEHPFTRLSVASFVGDDLHIRASVKSAFTELSTRNRVAALDWRRDAAVTYPFSENSSFAIGWREFNDFTLQLLRFVRYYRSFLGTSNSQIRTLSLGRYESSFRNVLTYFFDSDFLAALRKQLECLNQSPTQYTMGFDIDNEVVQIGALTRLGLSKRAAQRFLTQVEFSKKRTEEECFYNPQDALMSVLKADFIIRQRISLVRELSRAEKKVQKKDLTIGTISIAYGLVLLLRSHSEDKYTSSTYCQKLALDAIRAGVKNLAPSNEIRDVSQEMDNLFRASS